MIKSKCSNVVDFPSRRCESKQQALERLFAEHSGALRSFLCARLGVVEDLDDLVQEVFIRLARMEDLRERLPIGEGRNRSFLFKVANNLAIDLERHKLVHKNHIDLQRAITLEEDQWSGVSPEKEALTAQQLEYLKGAIEQLRPKWRKAFVLNRFMQMSYREVAQEMGVSIKQIEKYMKHALVHMRYAVLELKQANQE